jgi:sugar/nucleoside kinase (ribokinase family)
LTLGDGGGVQDEQFGRLVSGAGDVVQDAPDVVAQNLARLVDSTPGGVDPSWIVWRPYDGVGREVRNGLNFTERGFGVRGAVGVSDRGHTAASQLRSEEVDWDRLFGEQGARWLHTGGIYAALSEQAAETALAAATRSPPG